MSPAYPKSQQLERGPKRPARIKATAEEWERIRVLKVGPCRLQDDRCSRRGELHHLVPRSWLGDDVPDCIVPLCAWHHLAVTDRSDPEILRRVAASLTDAEKAYCVGKLGPGAMERLFGVVSSEAVSATDALGHGVVSDSSSRRSV